VTKVEPTGQQAEATAQEAEPTRKPAGQTEPGGNEAAKPRRRQARGERRITQLLEAAASVFCAVGYPAASTNAIAREAGVSPGTLYQFFPNKEAIAVELGERLIHRMRETHGQAFTEAHAELPLAELLDAVLDPLIEFNCRNPAFLALIDGTELPGRIVEEHDALHAAVRTSTEQLIAAYAPGLTTAQRTRTAAMAFSLFKACIELVLSHQGAERDAYIAETKAALYRYLAPVIGTEAATTRR
jgi:AcrR family transcriptional regulator